MLLNNYANTINQNEQSKENLDENNNTYRNSKRGLSRLLCLNNNTNDSDNSYPGSPSFSTILFFILILLILFFFNNNNNS